MLASKVTVSERFLEYARQFDIRVIYDCGSRHALDGIALRDGLNSRELHIFEANPPAADECIRNVAQAISPETITVNQMAVAEKSGEVEFFPIDPSKTVTPWADGNLGASSMFRANTAYEHERYVQTRTRVAATSLNDYARTHAVPDLLWVDLQGAELMAFRGASEILSSVKLIHVELSFKPVYQNQPLFWEVHAFLTANGFVLTHLRGRPCRVAPPRFLWHLPRMPWQGDAVYVASRLRR
jgi:FkbM family methyltransferase